MSDLVSSGAPRAPCRDRQRRPCPADRLPRRSFRHRTVAPVSRAANAPCALRGPAATRRRGVQAQHRRGHHVRGEYKNPFESDDPYPSRCRRRSARATQVVTCPSSFHPLLSLMRSCCCGREGARSSTAPESSTHRFRSPGSGGPLAKANPPQRQSSTFFLTEGKTRPLKLG